VTGETEPLTALAVFDIDGTLTRFRSSERLFARYLIRHGCLGPRALLHYAGFLLRNAGRFRGRVWKKNKAYLVGLPRDRLEELATGFVTRQVLPALAEPALRRLRQHQSNGDAVGLLSGTPDFIANCLARDLGVGLVEATSLEYRDGRVAAGAPLSHPLGEEKVRCLQRLAGAAGRSLEQLVVYANSRDDIPMMRAAGKAVAVNPDAALRRIADAEGWEILDH